MSAIQFRERELAEQSSYLYRFALLKLRDEDLAREAVQDTMLAALENGASFAGKSSFKTWLTAILKFKIVDLIRRQAKEPTVSEVSAPGFDGDNDDAMFAFDLEGSWREPVSAWQHPEQALEQKRFWEMFERALETLPPKTQRVFTMRDVWGHSTEEICKEMNITETNCWVILHRARMAMREHLSKHWFNNITQGTLDAVVPGDLPAAVRGNGSQALLGGAGKR